MEDEYRGRSTHDLMGLLAFMIDLKAKGKLKKFAESYVKEKVRRYENSRNINYPSHYEDRKWIRTAIATKAAFILTTNKHLLDTPPNISNGDEIKIVTPETYIQAH
jgi:predicted nucleic acid-binding protein